MNQKRSQMRCLRGVTLALLPLFTGGCYTTTIHSGLPAKAATVEYDQKWHHGLVYGIAELSGPYNLARVCPQGWASIETETSFLNGLVGAVTSGIYSPQTITVHCATAPATPLLPAAPASPSEPAPPTPNAAAMR